MVLTPKKIAMLSLRNKLFLGLSLLISCQAHAQFMNYGADPARLKWNIVKLPHYNLIYPQGNDSMAYRYATYLENVYPHLQKTIGKPAKVRFPVILHPNNMYSNGMVSWAPKRMELITTPSSDLEMQSWDKHLVIHESRHVFQTGKAMQGVFKPLYYLLGEQAAGVTSFLLPTWFLEGDAVSTETALSNGGRGRLPEFSMIYRAQLLAGNRNYSFDKWYMGSYRNYTGSHYALGYNLTSYARQRYGADIWKKTMTRYTRIPLFSKSFKHFTGSSISQLYSETFDHLKSSWAEQDTATRVTAYLSPEKRSYTAYRHPQVVNDSTIIAWRSGLKETNALVAINAGKERRLTYIGAINSRLSLHNGCIYWTELTPGIRWEHESYSELKCYDLQTGRTTTLTPRQRYQTVAIDPAGGSAALSRPCPDGRNELVLMGLPDGEERARFQLPNNGFATALTFAENDAIIAVVVDDNGTNLWELRCRSGRWKQLLQVPSVHLTSLIWHQGSLYFESGLNGTNNIYRFDLNSHQAYRITDARFGAFDPVFDANGRLIYADYQSTGYRIAALSANEQLNVKSDLTTPKPTPFVDELAAQEVYNIDTAPLDSVAFQPKPYHKTAHLFKIHSWAPFYYDVSGATRFQSDDLSTLLKPGAMILSQNALNTATLQAGWYYDKSFHHGKLAFTYQGWFPVVDLSVDYGGKSVDLSWVKSDENQPDELLLSGTDRTLIEAEANIYIPFNLSKNERIRGIQPIVSYYFTNNRYQQIDSRNNRNFQYILPELWIYNYRKKAQRDLLPRSGYQLRLQYLHSPFNSENFGSLYAARLTTYWPGLLPNHGLMIRLGYQYQALDGKALYLPKQLLESTRGYNYQIQTHQQYMLKADYALSLFSPDLSLGSLAYFRRMRANLFYDLTRNQATLKPEWTLQSSAGVDLNLDWNAFRMPYPLTTGVRLTRPFDSKQLVTEMLFSVSF